MSLKSLAALFTVLIGLTTLPLQTAIAAPPAKAFGELPVAYDAAISPDGQRLAIIVNVKGTYAVLAQKIDQTEANPWVVPLGEKIKPGYIKWVNNDRYVASISKSEKYKGTPFTIGYLFTANVKTRDGKLLVKPRNMFRQFNNKVVSWLEQDPDHILMAYSDEPWDPYPDIKKVNVETGRDTTIKRGVRGIEYWSADTDGIPRVGSGRVETGKAQRVIYNPATDKWDRVRNYPGLTAEMPIHGILKKGKELVVGDYAGKNTIGLYVYDLEQKKISRKLYHNDKYDSSDVILSKDGETVIGAKYTAESSRTELLGEYGTLLTHLRRKFTDYDVDFVDQTEDGDTVLVSMSSPYDPGGLFIYNAKDPDPTRLSKMYNGITASDTGNVVPVKYTARDGQVIPGFVTVPAGITSPKNLPFIILPHGGPYGRDAARFDYFAQFFATRGYGVLQMNFRGSDGYGKSFEEAGRNNWVVMQEDVEDGTRWLMDKGYADPSRTCIAGWSYGGYAALMGVAKDPELYKCAIAMAALTDIAGAKRNMREYRGGRFAAKEFFGEAMDDRATRMANTPIHVADDIKVPVFLAHGTLDENVQFEQFTRMKKALKKAGVDGTYMEFKDEDHYLSNQKHREDFFVGVEKFLLNVNGPSEYMKK